MCSTLDMSTREVVGNCDQCEEGTMVRPLSGFSADIKVKVTCENPAEIMVDFCPASEPKICTYVVRARAKAIEAELEAGRACWFVFR